jgi:hypothetical protein
METMQQYVARKLQEPYINVRAVCRIVRVGHGSIYGVIEGKKVTADVVQRLHDFFRKISD